MDVELQNNSTNRSNGFSKRTHLIIGVLILLAITIMVVGPEGAKLYLVLALAPLLIVVILVVQARRGVMPPKSWVVLAQRIIPVAAPAAVFLISVAAALIYFSPVRLEARMVELRRVVLPSRFLLVDQPYPISNKMQMAQIAEVQSRVHNAESLGLHLSPEIYLEAGLLSFSIKDSRSAEALFLKAVEAASKRNTESGSTLTIAYIDWGVTLTEQKKVDKSLQAFDAALKSSSERPLTLVAELNRASAYRYKGRYDEAIAIVNQVLSATDVPDYLRAIALRTKGVVAEDKSEAIEGHDALYYYTQASDLFKSSGNLPELAITYNNIGNIYINRPSHTAGDIDQAITYHKTAWQVSDSLNDEAGKADSQAYLAYDYFVQGDLDRALQYGQQALEVFRRKGKPPDLAAVLDTIGQIYQKKRDVQNAISSLQESLMIAKEAGLMLGQAETLKNLATVYASQNDCKNATRLFLESQFIFMQIGAEERAKEVVEMMSKACQTGTNQKEKSSP